MVFLQKHVFAIVLGISTLAHASLFLWYGPGDALPRLIAAKRGRASMAMRGSIQAIASTEPTPAEQPKRLEKQPTPLPEEPIYVAALPQLPDLTLDIDIKWEELVSAAIKALPDIKPVSKEPPKPKEQKPPERKVPESKPVKKDETVTKKSPVDSQASASSRASEGSDVEELPQILTNPSPRYPADALAAGVEGRVVLRTRVEADGTVSAVSVHESSGVASMDESALVTVRRWRFVPARSGGVAVPIEVAVPVRFEMRYR